MTEEFRRELEDSLYVHRPLPLHRERETETKRARREASAAVPIRAVPVSDGAALDINGAEVATKEYWRNGERQPGGTYRAHNGTIYVASKGVMIICR